MNESERDRYSRQIVFPPIGESGQEKLKAARVAIAGCGALGSFQAGALARAGIGFLRLIDRDFVELSNLQRQWLFDEEDARDGIPKAVAAARSIGKINSQITVEAAVADLAPESAHDLLGDVDLILDGTDNFETRYLLNDFAVKHAKPWVYGGAVGSYGIAMTILPGRSACFECIYPQPPSGSQPTCETAGVLNTIPSMVASWQVAFAIQMLCNPLFQPVMVTMNAWPAQVRSRGLGAPDLHCGACGLRTFRHLAGIGRAPISLCGRNAVQIHDRTRPLDLVALGARLAPIGTVRQNEFALRFSHEKFELTVFPDGRAIVKGTTDPGLARSLYSRYVGN